MYTLIIKEKLFNIIEKNNVTLTKLKNKQLQLHVQENIYLFLVSYINLHHENIP